MHRRITVLILALWACLSVIVFADDGDPPDAFGQFYLQTRKVYSETQKTDVANQLAMLAEVQREAAESSQSPHRHAAMVWVAQEYSRLGKPEAAVSLFNTVLGAADAPETVRQVARFELGLAFSRLNQPERAEATWLDMLRDDKVSPSLRETAAEQIRASRMSRGDWKGAREIAEIELAQNMGKIPILYETVARGARKTKDFRTAVDFYARLLKEYPNFRPRNRMIYIDKAATMAKHENQEERIGYLEDLAAVASRYEQEARQANTVWAEVYQEYYNIANGYSIAPQAYKEWGVAMPISVDEAQTRALTHYRSAIEGLKRLPPDQRANIGFDAVVSGSYRGAAAILHHQNRDGEAAKLLEEMLQRFPELEQDRLVSAQRYMNMLMVGSIDPGDAKPRIPLDIADPSVGKQPPATKPSTAPAIPSPLAATPRPAAPVSGTPEAGGVRPAWLWGAFVLGVLLLSAWWITRRRPTAQL